MATDTTEGKQTRSLTPREWIRLTVLLLLLPVLLLMCGGDASWWQAWLVGLLIVGAGLGGRVLAERRHPGLLAERVDFGAAAEAKAWDKVLSPLMAFGTSFPLVIIAGLDHRFGWTEPLPAWTGVPGLMLVAIGYGFATWAFVENAFFSGVVRIQRDRGHVVCDSGPYTIVRHPGYAGTLKAVVGLPLALSSVWTFIPAAMALGIIVLRTALEDRTLQEELPGYKAYASRVRYRLVPRVY